MITSKLTKRTYDPDNGHCVYMSNPQQCFFYLSTIGYDHLLDILCDGSIRENMLVFVWEKCPETAECKRQWDENGRRKKSNKEN